MRARLGPWAATLGIAAITSVALAVAALIVGTPGALPSVGVAVALFVVVGVVSLPVLGAMGISPSLAFLVAMTTYAFQVLLGALLLRAGRPGGPLDGVLDQRWLGVAVVCLAVLITVGAVSDQLRGARRQRAHEMRAAAEGDVTFDRVEPTRR